MLQWDEWDVTIRLEKKESPITHSVGEALEKQALLDTGGMRVSGCNHNIGQ